MRRTAYKWAALLLSGGVTFQLLGGCFGSGGLKQFVVDTMIQIAARGFFNYIKTGNPGT